MKRSIWLLAAGLLAAALLPTSARATGDDVPTQVDNPEGCTTATAESDDGCGAQGRDHWGNEGHTPPIKACATSKAQSGSTVTRIVPDGPRRADDGSLAFTPGVCVYLPPGYDASTLRYPVVYLLHGGGGDQADWVTFGDVRDILDAAYEQDESRAVIAVMPDGRSGQYYDYEDGRFLIEQYILRHLVPEIDARFRTIADRSGRAIAGLSNGGYGALHLAAKAPDLFSVAGSMSGNLGARTMSGLGDSNAAYYQGNVPYQLASNLDEVDLIIDWGATCSSDITVDLCATWAFEQAFRGDNTAFHSRLAEVGYKGKVDYRETEGSHAWRWWTKWLAERDVPFFFERLAPPSEVAATPGAVPASFRYRTIAPSFSVWGYDVEVDRSVREFLDLTDVGLGSISAKGSGTVTVTTAGRYTPGLPYEVEGATDDPSTVIADADGRLVVQIDLGPAHPQDQFTPQANLAEAQGSYWVQRNVRITPGDAADPLAPTWPSYGGPAPGAVTPGPSVFDVVAPTFVAPAPDVATAGPKATQRVATIAASLPEPVRKVSIPLTAVFLGSIAAGVVLAGRRMRAKTVT